MAKGQINLIIIFFLISLFHPDSDVYLFNRVTSIFNEEDSVDIRRPGKWGNPFPVNIYGRKVAIQKFETYLMQGLINDIEELRGKKLFCVCHPLPCHGDILLKNLYKK